MYSEADIPPWHVRPHIRGQNALHTGMQTGIRFRERVCACVCVCMCTGLHLHYLVSYCVCSCVCRLSVCTPNTCLFIVSSFYWGQHRMRPPHGARARWQNFKRAHAMGSLSYPHARSAPENTRHQQHTNTASRCDRARVPGARWIIGARAHTGVRRVWVRALVRSCIRASMRTCTKHLIAEGLARPMREWRGIRTKTTMLLLMRTLSQGRMLRVGYPCMNVRVIRLESFGVVTEIVYQSCVDFSRYSINVCST